MMQAPDSMALRGAIIARLKAGTLTQFEFETAQKAIASLRRVRQKLERLGFEFDDTPDRRSR